MRPFRRWVEDCGDGVKLVLQSIGVQHNATVTDGWGHAVMRGSLEVGGDFRRWKDLKLACSPIITAPCA